MIGYCCSCNIKNKNENVLAFLNKQKGFTGKVAAFSIWDVFPYILNKWRSGIYVNSDTDTLHFNNSNLSLINDMQFLTAQPLNVRPDILTYMAAREYMKAYQPRVLHMCFHFAFRRNIRAHCGHPDL